MPSGVVTPPNISLFHLFSRDQDKETNKVSTLGEMKKRSLKLKTTKHLLRRFVNGCKPQVQKTDLEKKLVFTKIRKIFILGKRNQCCSAVQYGATGCTAAHNQLPGRATESQASTTFLFTILWLKCMRILQYRKHGCLYIFSSSTQYDPYLKYV